MLKLNNPAAFLFLLLPLLLLILRHFKLFKKVSIPAVLADWNGAAFQWNSRGRRLLSRFARLMFLAAYVLVIISLADPLITRQEKVFTTLGTDMLFAVDTSPSMAAVDMGGQTRLEAARSTIKQIILENEGTRFGLVALGSDAAVLVPPTSDASVMSERLGELQVGILGNGSAIGDGLSTAVCHLVSSSAPKKCIVLFTDGENNAGEIHPETAARLASENSITIYVVGIGTKGSVPIEYTDPATGKRYSGYLDSSYDSASLRRIADNAGGRYFEVTTIQDLLLSLKMISQAENTPQSFIYRSVSHSYYRNFLMIAIILFIASAFFRKIVLGEVV